MKNFKTFLRETHTSHQNQAIDNNMNMGVYSDPAVVRKLNAWVGTIAGNYVLPEDAVSKLRSSLSKIGLTFDAVPVMEGESGILHNAKKEAIIVDFFQGFESNIEKELERLQNPKIKSSKREKKFGKNHLKF